MKDSNELVKIELDGKAIISSLKAELENIIKDRIHAELLLRGFATA